MAERERASLVSLVTTGNIGVGKSLVLNCLLGREQFVHRISARPVTTDAERVDGVELRMGSNSTSTTPVSTTIWNLQGMTEPGAAHADRNRAALSTAFESAPRQVVMFVAQHNNGRLRHEDAALFAQLMRVYRLRPEATIVLFNRLSSEALPAMQAFCRVTEFCATDSLRCGALRTLSTSTSSLSSSSSSSSSLCTGPDARANADVIRALLLRCVPVAHTAHGQVVLEEEELALWRRRIVEVQAAMTEDARRHGERMSEIARQEAEVKTTMDEAKVAHDQSLEEMEKTRREREVIYQGNVGRLQQALAEIKQYHTECRDVEVTAQRDERRRKRFGKRVESVVREFRRHPLKIAPLVASACLPVLAPVVATTIGVSTTVASAGLGAAIGASSAAINRGNVLKGALTGGVGALAPPTVLAQTSVAMGTALVERRDPLAAGLGSVVGNAIPGGGGIVESVARSTTTATVTSLVSDPRNLSQDLAQGLVSGAIVGATSNVVRSMDLRRSNNSVSSSSSSTSSSRPVVREGGDTSTTVREQQDLRSSPPDNRSIDVSVFTSRRYRRYEGGGSVTTTTTSASTTTSSTRSIPSLPSSTLVVVGGGRSLGHSSVYSGSSIVGGEGLGPSSVYNRSSGILSSRTGGEGLGHSSVYSGSGFVLSSARGGGSPSSGGSSTHSTPSLSSSVTLTSSGGVSVSANGVYVSPHLIGVYSSTGRDGTSIRRAIGASDLYDGGFMFSTSVTTPPTTALTSGTGSTTSTTVAIQPTSSRIVNETIGTCFASRTRVNETVNQSGQTRSTTTVEEHFNTEGCLGNPGRALVGSAAIMVAPGLMSTIVPLTTAITAPAR